MAGFIQKLRLLVGISIFWLALSMLFDGINTLVLPSRLLEVTGEGERATVLGLLTFIGLLAGMLIQPVAGALSDRLQPRWGRQGWIGLGVLLMLASLAIFAWARGLLWVALGYLLVQAAASLAQSAQQGFIPDLVPTEQRGAASGLKGFMDIGGAMLGFLVLGQLLGSGNPGLALMAIAAVLAIAFLLSAVLVRERSAEPAKPPTWSGAVPSAGIRFSLVDAFRFDFRRRPAFAWLVFSRFLFLLGIYAIGRFLLYFVSDRLALDPARAGEQAGNLLAGLAFVTVLASLPAGWAADRFGRGPLMLYGAGLSGLGALLFIGSGSAFEIFAAGGLMAFGSAAFSSANWALTADLAPPGQSARFMALANFGTAGAAASAGLFGPLVDVANAHTPGAGYTLLFVAAALAFIGSGFASRGAGSGSFTSDPGLEKKVA